ncbi:MAG: N-acetyltransferase family protein [Pseudomonadota bacterium]
MRVASLADAPGICEIANHYIRHTTISFNDIEKTADTIEADIAASQTNGLPYLVSADGATLHGFATCTPFRKGSGYRFTLEHTILLAPDRTGQGRGSALLLALQNVLADTAVHTLIAGISAENQNAVAFHTRHGFAEVGRIAQAGVKFDRLIDLILMQKRLSSARANR